MITLPKKEITRYFLTSNRKCNETKQKVEENINTLD